MEGISRNYNYLQLVIFLSALYLIVDDLYQLCCLPLLCSKPGPQPKWTAREVLTLTLAQPLLGLDTERVFLHFACSHRRHLFPQLLDPSQFNRRMRALGWVLHRIRWQAVQELNACFERYPLLDTPSVPVMKRHCCFGRTSLLLGEATGGYCTSKRGDSVGFKRALLATLNEMITDIDWVPTPPDDREAVEDVLNPFWSLIMLGDKGFFDEDWQASWQQRRAHLLLTPKQVNPQVQNPKELDRLLRRV